MKKIFTKRTMAVMLSLVLALSSLAGCTKSSDNNANTSNTGNPTAEPTSAGTAQATKTPEKDPDPTPTPVPVVIEDSSKLNEAPMLADQVSAGKLPSLEDRIPVTEDLFVESVDATGAELSIGNYGGVINLGGAGGSWGLSRPTLESIVRYNTDGSYYPNVIKAYEHNADYTEWTFYLRKGMKWSDGDDFNADDITFWYYMCHLNNFDSKKSWAALKETVNDEDAWATLTKVDDYTVKWTFVNPKFPADFIENGDFKWCWAPSHYLNDLIPQTDDFPWVENPYWAGTGLNDEQVLANAQAKNIDSATVKDLGKAVAYNFWNTAGIPTLSSFVLSTVPGNSSKDDTLCIMNRNAYYWKVDAEGNQLPYCDAIHFNATSEDGQDLLMFRSGELDIISIAMQDIASTMADLGSAAELRSFASSNWGSYQITFNYTTTDKNYADLFANINFRQAMSICVDRNQVSELLSDGFLEPGQAAPAEGNFGYDAEWEKKWTEYDVNNAKTLFESCGLVMGSDGFYNFADGSDLMLTFYTYTDSGADAAYPVLEQYFKAAGINCAQKDLEVSAFDTEIDNNTWNACLIPHTAIGGLSLRSRVAPFVPISQAAEWYGEYGTYYGTNGAQGVAPTGDMAKLVEIYEKWNATPDSAERDAYTLDIYEIHKANLWTIAYLKAAGNYNLISSKLKNHPNNLVWDDLYQYANITHYEALYKVD